jgi:hypothetical protein
MKKIIISIVTVLFLSVAAKAQFPAGYGWVMPRESQSASVSQTVGVTEIAIKYHRPAVKGRVIWGCRTEDVLQKPGAVYPCLVPNGQVWRAGANDATTVSFSTDVKIEGQPLPAGTYGLFMIPGESEWTIAFNKRAKQWGAFTYSDKEDVLRVKVAPQTAEQTQERLEYAFPVVSNDAAQIALRWEKMKIVFNVAVDSAKQSSTKAKTAFDPSSGYFAADYYYQNKTNLEEALKWINAALAFDENGGNLLLKAKILAELKRYQEAVETGEKAVVFFKSKNLAKPAEDTQKLIDEWKSSKPAKE